MYTPFRSRYKVFIEVSSCFFQFNTAFPRSNWCFQFYHHKLVLPGIELHINELRYYILLYLVLLDVTMCVRFVQIRTT